MNWQQDELLKNLPGGELVSAGIKDLSEGQYETVSALLVSMAAPRLAFLGFDIPDYPEEDTMGAIHQKLYRLLEESIPDAHSQYNALQRRLMSFCAIAESQIPLIPR